MGLSIVNYLRNSVLFVTLFFCLMSFIPAMTMPLQHGVSLTPKKASSLNIEEYYVSEKLDGIRGYWDGETLYSRQGYAIVAPAWFIANLGEIPLDGEIWLGRETFQELSGLIARNDVKDPLWEKVTYQIFDLPAEQGVFKERVEKMKDHIEHLSQQNPHLNMIKQEKIASLPALDELLEIIIEKGGERINASSSRCVISPLYSS